MDKRLERSSGKFETVLELEVAVLHSYEEGKSLRQIATEVEVSSSTVGRIVSEHTQKSGKDVSGAKVDLNKMFDELWHHTR